jgi:hypothetical protein
MRRLTSLLLLAATPALAQTVPAISTETLKAVTQELASDAYEGRAPTTAGEEKTIRYLIQRFTRAGLKPGNKGQWTQDVPMVEITAQDVRPFTFTGGKAPVTMAYRTDMVAGTYRVTPSIEVKDSPVVFVGYGITAPEKGWDDYAGIDVRGKTVVILVNDPDWQTLGKEGPFEGRAMTWYGRWPYKFENAAKHGAAAAIIVHETEPAAYGWPVVQSSWTGPQYGLDEPGNHMDHAARQGAGAVRQCGQGLCAALGRGAAEGVQGGAARGHHVGRLLERDQAVDVEERGRRAAGTDAPG